MDKRTSTVVTQRRRLGAWLPEHETVLAQFRLDLAHGAQAHISQRRRRSTIVEELSGLVHDDPVLRMDLTRAIDDACKAGFILGYASIDELMDIIDYLMTYAPPFSESSLIHCPLNAVLDWPMCMPSGYALFQDPALNAQLKCVLNYWCGFLDGPHSRVHLNTNAPDGWFSDAADRHIGLSQFICDKEKPYWGFASWNAFFTRQFRPGVRCIDAPDDDDVVISPCEAAPYSIQRNVRLHDQFWLKSQPYSLREMFTAKEPELAERFVDGDVYQAFLSAFNYHRWHAPVSGTVTHAYLVDGSYYSEAESEGVDPSGLNDSQGYISAVAASSVIVIESDDTTIGSVGCIFVGMAEVSSCVVDALPGQHVQKGDELGYFQYGGSTCCVVFQPGVVKSFARQGPFSHDEKPLHVNARLATIG